jgi:glyoxylase-like metal-dependent hydrolase (beta-lactamase superfamily II)
VQRAGTKIRQHLRRLSLRRNRAVSVAGMQIGDYRLEIIPDTEFRLDGGAMFGVVPRLLWERVSPADEFNRIRMNMNCVFIDTGADKILIETGIGEKWTEKELSMYGIFRENPLAETLLEKTGCTTDDITIVVNTHLHFDHAGGNTIARTADATQPQFRNARYFVSKSELDHAMNPHERDRASYLPSNWEPLIESEQLELQPDDYEVVDGLRMQTVTGHSQTMQTWRLDRGGQTVYGFADLIPTRNHLALPWIMGYDLYPTETLEFKKSVLPKAVDQGWLCLFYHDIDAPLRTVRMLDGKLTSEAYGPAGLSA